MRHRRITSPPRGSAARRHTLTGALLALVAVTGLVLSTAPSTAGALDPATSVASFPVETVDYRFAGNLTDSASGSTLTEVAACGTPQPAYSPCNSVTAFGNDLDGDYWSWSSTSTAGGGVRVTTNAPVGTTYTMSLKFSFASVAAGTNGYSKIVDYRNRASDDGFYFQFGRLKYFPGPSTSSTVFTNNSVLDLVTVRQATGPNSGTFTVYMVGPDKKLTQQFVYNDTSGSSIPSTSGAGNLFGFFFDDSTTPNQREATPSGRVYAIKMWANTALTPQQIEEAIVPPTRPTITSATPGDTSIQVSWNAVAGASSYTAIAQPGDERCTVAAPATTCTLGSLTNGSPYSVTVVATNANGASQPSIPASATPRTVPAAPTALAATAGDSEATIVFTESDDGGSPITNYEYSLDGTNWTAFSPAETGSPVIVPGLTNNTGYSIRLRAVNAAGAGAASDPVSVTPVPTPARPDAPTNLVATPGDTVATVTFTPGDDRGSPITNYEYSFDGGRNWTAFAPAVTASPVSFTALTNGTTYELVLRAVNAVGAGDASEPVEFTPAKVPDPPTGLVATPGDGTASVEFTLGADGGSPITEVEYSIDGGPWQPRTPTSIDSPLQLDGLTNGTTYSIRLRAVNDIGPSDPSVAVTVTPLTVPDPPIDLVAQPGDGSAVIEYVDGDNGGSPITATEMSIDGGEWQPTTAAPSGRAIELSGLSNGTTYTVELRSVNAVGAGKSSSPVTVTPTSEPVPPDDGSGGGRLPTTGGTPAMPIGLGIVLVGIGLVLVMATARRRRA